MPTLHLYPLSRYHLSERSSLVRLRPTLSHRGLDRPCRLVIRKVCRFFPIRSHVSTGLVLLLASTGQSNRKGSDHQVRVSYRVTRLLHDSSDDCGAEHHAQDVSLESQRDLSDLLPLQVRGHFRRPKPCRMASSTLAIRQFGVRTVDCRWRIWSRNRQGIRLL